MRLVRTMARGRASALAATLAAASLAAAAQPAAPDTVVVSWNAAALAEVRLGRLGPPVVARALAIAHTCMYDAWTAYDAVAIPLTAPVLRRPLPERIDANKAKAISHAAYQCLINLFPAGAGRLQAQMRRLGHDPADAVANLATPSGIGNLAAQAVILSRRHDGSNQYGDLAPGAYADPTGYRPANGPMPFCLPATVGPCALNITDPLRWQPLTSDQGAVQQFIAPHWAQVRPFALSSARQYDLLPEVAAGPRYTRSTADLLADVEEMLRYSRELTPLQKLIVEYWADGPESELPPGHWGLLAQHVSRRDRHGIDDDVKMFFAMHNASFDAGIVGWHLKRRAEGVRPITLVRLLKQGQVVQAWGGPGRPVQAIDGGKWSPYNPGSNLSPAFPGWVSGHAIFSAASGTVLQRFKGSDHLGYVADIPAGFGRVEPGVPPVRSTLAYPSFSAAVADAGLSRLYAGIHFADDNTLGQDLGRRIGVQALAKSQHFFDGGLRRRHASAVRTSLSGGFQWSHTVPDEPDRLLVVGLSSQGGPVSAVTSVRYAGLALRRLGGQTDPSGQRTVELWYLVAPPAGTAAVQVQLSGPKPVVAGATAYAGVHAQQPFGPLRAAAQAGTLACVDLANPQPEALVAGLLAAGGDAVSVVSGPLQAPTWRASSSPLTAWTDPQSVVGAGFTAAAVPNSSVCQGLGRATGWALLAVPLTPAYR